MNVMVWAFFSLLFSGIYYVVQWGDVALGNYTEHRMQYVIWVGMVMPGLIGLTAFPALIQMAVKANGDLARGKIYDPDED